jgi:TolB protein
MVGIIKGSTMFAKLSFNIPRPLLMCFLILAGCKDNGNPADGGGGISPPLPIPITAYHSPIWHPGGRFIGFNHTPFKTLHYSNGGEYPDKYELDVDSTGFWLVNADGTNMRRIFPYQLQTPAWSPDGEWIAFVAGAQVFKMRLIGTTFDTTTLVQLTTEGSNFFPAWRPDGLWMTYDRSLADSSGPGGIWIMKPDGTQKHAVFGGAFPTWHANGQSLLGVIGASPTSIWTRFVKYYPFRVAQPETLLVVIGNENLYPKYSPNGQRIAFASRPLNGLVNLWIMDSTGSNSQQLTSEGMSDNSGIPFSWDPTGNFVVFTRYRFDQWPPQNGTLWTLNLATGEKRQLTFNPQSSN